MRLTADILLLAASTVAFGVSGCNNGTPSGRPAYAAGLREAAQESALYSISFDEQGPFLLTLFPVTATQLTCAAPGALTSATMILELWTPLATGTFAVGPSNSDSFPPASGQAVVIFRNGSSESLPIEILPTEGQVVITSAPNDAAGELTGTHLAGSFHLGFPANPIYPSDCFGGGEVTADGGLSNLESWCLCTDASGNTVSVCDGGEMSECCLATGSASIFVDSPFDAPPCGTLCIDPLGTGLCDPLFPDAGADDDAGSCQNIVCSGVCCNPGENCELTTCCPDAQSCDGVCCAMTETCLPAQPSGEACCPQVQTCGSACCTSSETCLRDDAGAMFCGS